MPSGSKRSVPGADVVLAVLLFAGVVAYLSSLPRALGAADESYFLYEAKRISDGEVMYRDIFQFVTPLSSYAMAFLFWAFGTTMATARTGMAAVHGLTVVFLYAICRALGIRRALAALPGLAHLAICQPAWPFASPHWFSTQLAMVLLLVLVAGPWPTRPRWAFFPGLVTGLLIGVQQQRGVVIAAGVCALFLADHLLSRRYPGPERSRWLATRLGFFLAGLSLIVVPLLATFIAMAGFQPVFDAMVVFPLHAYRPNFRIHWGLTAPLAGVYSAATFPMLLKYMILVLLVPLARSATKLVARAGREELRTLTVLIVFAVSSAGSVWYFPDVIHLAFIAPVFWVCAAEAAEWGLSRIIRPPRLSLALGWILTIVLGFGLVFHLSRHAAAARQAFPISHDTAFGRVDFSSRWEPILVDTVRQLLGQTASQELFCYPNASSPYLTTGGKNPTPFQFFTASISPPEQTRTVLSILETRRVPYVIVAPLFFSSAGPVVRLINERYEPVSIPEIVASDELPGLFLYRRKGLQPAGAPPSEGGQR